MEKIINILGLYPKGMIMYRSKIIKRKYYFIIIEPITKDIELEIDKTGRIYGQIRYKRTNTEIIEAKDILLYGKVDLNNSDDLDNIEDFNIIEDGWESNWVPSNFNYDNGTYILIDNIRKGCPTYNPITWFKYCHVLIGKPERVIIYKKHFNKNSYFL